MTSGGSNIASGHKKDSPEINDQAGDLAGPVWDKKDILVADLDLAAVIEARFDFDVCGHYSRPDVFTLLVNEQPRNDTGPGHLPGGGCDRRQVGF